MPDEKTYSCSRYLSEPEESEIFDILLTVLITTMHLQKKSLTRCWSQVAKHKSGVIWLLLRAQLQIYTHMPCSIWSQDLVTSKFLLFRFFPHFCPCLMVCCMKSKSMELFWHFRLLSILLFNALKKDTSYKENKKTCLSQRFHS